MKEKIREWVNLKSDIKECLSYEAGRRERLMMRVVKIVVKTL